MKKRKILIIEDEALLLKLLTVELQSAGFEIAPAMNGETKVVPFVQTIF